MSQKWKVTFCKKKTYCPRLSPLSCPMVKKKNRKWLSVSHEKCPRHWYCHQCCIMGQIIFWSRIWNKIAKRARFLFPYHKGVFINFLDYVTFGTPKPKKLWRSKLPSHFFKLPKFLVISISKNVKICNGQSRIEGYYSYLMLQCFPPTLDFFYFSL